MRSPRGIKVLPARERRKARATNMSRAFFGAILLTACAGEIPRPSPYEAVNPQAPEATFDAGAYCLSISLPAAPDKADAPTKGHDHGGSTMPMKMPTPSSSATPTPEKKK